MDKDRAICKNYANRYILIKDANVPILANVALS